MQEVIPPQDSTLNQNIAKELIWRRNAPYFYQTLYTQELEWPSLCIEWWADQSEKLKNDQNKLYHVLYGTHTSNQEKNSLIMAKVYLPNHQKNKKNKPLKPIDTVKKNDETFSDRIMVQHIIEHDGQVNRIKHHPRKMNLIATRTPLGQIHIFDKIRFGTSSKGGKAVKVNPTIILSGHETEGYSLEWNLIKQGQIIAGSYDGKLSIWDISSKQQNNQIRPLAYFNFHNKEIEDVSFNKFHDSLFASCDDEGQTVLWDTRNAMEPVFHMQADRSTIYSVQFSPLDRHIFSTGGKDQLIKIWDIRNLSQSLLQYRQQNQISQLKWSNQQKDMLWSVSKNRINLWDLTEQKKIFVHGGHLEQINHMDLHPFEDMTVASVDNSNDIHIFQPTPNLRT